MTVEIDVLLSAAWWLASVLVICLFVKGSLSEKDGVTRLVEALVGQSEARAPQTDLSKVTRDLNSNPAPRSNHIAPASAEDGQTVSRTMLAVLLGAVWTLAAAPNAHAGRFVFDQRRTEVRFVYKMAYSTQRGRFTKVTGTLNYDEAAPEKSNINASIATASLTTGEALVDNELKGPAFFNVESSPIIAFKSRKVQPTSATNADVLGDITVNGITKPVTLNVSLRPHDDPALKYDAGSREFVATTRIQRSAFNMTDYQSLVDDDIDIEIAAIVRPK